MILKRTLSNCIQRKSGYKYLKEPVWSVKSLLPQEGKEQDESISLSNISHLYKLSGLPVPSEEKSKELLLDLKNLIHFVHHIKNVDVDELEPLSHLYPVEELEEELEKEFDDNIHRVHMSRDSDRLKEWEIIAEDEKGQRLLNYAGEKYGNYYMVEKKDNTKKTGEENRAI